MSDVECPYCEKINDVEISSTHESEEGATYEQ